MLRLPRAHPAQIGSPSPNWISPARLPRFTKAHHSHHGRHGQIGYPRRRPGEVIRVILIIPVLFSLPLSLLLLFPPLYPSLYPMLAILVFSIYYHCFFPLLLHLIPLPLPIDFPIHSLTILSSTVVVSLSFPSLPSCYPPFNSSINIVGLRLPLYLPYVKAIE